MAVLRVHKDDTIPRENSDMSVLLVCKSIMLLKEMRTWLYGRVHKVVTLLREKGDMAILFPRKADKYHRS